MAKQPSEIGVLAMYKAIAKAQQAQRKMAESIARSLPVGTHVEWETQRNGFTYSHSGVVTSTGDDIYVIVKNSRTGKTSKIGISACYGFSVNGFRAP